MGGLFSSLGSSNTKGKSSNQTKFEDHIKTLENEAATYEAEAIKNVEARKQTMEDIFKRRELIQKRKMRDIEDIAAAYKQHINDKKTLNKQAANLLVCILFNYQNDHFMGIDGSFEDNTKVIIQTCLNVNSYRLLCKIPVLLPLLWIHGSADDIAQEYPLTSTGEIDLDAYKVKVESYIPAYVKNILPKLINNVCASNCRSFSFNMDEEVLNNEDTLCKTYLETISDAETDEEFFQKTIEFLNKFNDIRYKLGWKMLAAKARKGITSKQIHYLPKYYPRNSPKYELFECLLMLVNTICYNYGSIRNDMGEYVNADESGNIYVKSTTSNGYEKTTDTNHTYGGMCFDLPEKYINKQHQLYYDNSKSWDWLEYVKFNASYPIDPKEIVDVNNPSIWMTSSISVYEKTFVENISATTGIGRLKYTNPTRYYTYQLINDEASPEEKIELPKLGAKMSEKFETSIIYNLWNALVNLDGYAKQSLYKSKNGNLFTSFDFMIFAPEDYAVTNLISPTAYFVYEEVLAKSLRWNLTFPIENNVSMSKINNTIMADIKNSDALPQNAWINRIQSVSHGSYGNADFSWSMNYYNTHPQAYTPEDTIRVGVN